jgi:2,3-diketo-5-methylthio-1-phosphopentane phosphatase
MLFLSDRAVRALLLDIEGTTTPISFVHDVLFPYARRHLRDYLRAHRTSGELRDVVRHLAAEHAADLARGEQMPPWRTGGADEALASLESYVEWLMDRDRKSPGLKLLQGHIWEAGYRGGELRGQVFADVPAAIRRWRAAGLEIAIYSSGSELAQRRLFESSDRGDLTPYIAAYFDTAVGAKMDAASYTAIVSRLRLRPVEVLFVSDVTKELAAAREAGLQVLLSLRPGNAPQPDAAAYETIQTFDEIE